MASPQHISARMSDDEIEILDRLVVAVRAYYEREAVNVPALGPHLAKLAKETTRSSALRDLLLAWKHGKADEMFSRDITEAIK
jgi:hypothetical protein